MTILDISIVDDAIGQMRNVGFPMCPHATIMLQKRGQTGDHHMWRGLLRSIGVRESWIDSEPDRSIPERIAALETIRCIDAAGIAEVFGPNWAAVRDMARRLSVVTEQEQTSLGLSHRRVIGTADREDALGVCWGTAVETERLGALDMARDCVNDAAPKAMRYSVSRMAVVWDAVTAVVLADVVDRATVDVLTAEWVAVCGPIDGIT